MSHCIKYRLFVNLRLVSNYCGVDIVLCVVWSALFVKDEIPIDPGADKVIQIFDAEEESIIYKRDTYLTTGNIYLQ